MAWTGQLKKVSLEHLEVTLLCLHCALDKSGDRQDERSRILACGTTHPLEYATGGQAILWTCRESNGDFFGRQCF